MQQKHTLLIVSFLCLAQICQRVSTQGHGPRPHWPAPGEFADLVGLELQIRTRNFIHCGGTLVTLSQVVVTPQCFTAFQFVCSISGQKVFAGIVDYRNPNATHMQIRYVKGFLRHPQYSDSNQIQNAIMILTMNEPFKLTCAVRPALLPIGNPPLRTKCQLVFWRDIENTWVEPYRVLAFDKFLVECEGLYTQNYDGVLCFRDHGNKLMNTITVNDVYGTVYCNYYTVGILLLQVLNNKSLGFVPVIEYPAISLAHYRDWIFEEMVSLSTVPVKRSRITSNEFNAKGKIDGHSMWTLALISQCLKKILI